MLVYVFFSAARLVEVNPALTTALKHTSIRTALKEKGDRRQSVANVYVLIIIIHSFRSLHTYSYEYFFSFSSCKIPNAVVFPTACLVTLGFGKRIENHKHMLIHTILLYSYVIICLAVLFISIICTILLVLCRTMWSRRRTKNQLNSLKQDLECRLIQNPGPNDEVAGEDTDPADVDDHEDIELFPN